MQPSDCGQPEAGTAPYLSVVATALSGDAWDDLARVQLFMESWINQARDHPLDSELIIVAHDPPALRWPQGRSPCEVRVLDIPRETQIRGQPANRRLLLNAGIRRARGEFILATNIDIVFSNQLIEFLASRRLEPGRMYRADRYDVEPGIPAGATPEQRLDYCSSHLMRVSAREGVFPVSSNGLRRNAQEDIASINSGLSFGSGWFPPERYAATGETFRWIDNDAEILARVPDGGGILILEAEPGPGLGALPQTLQIFDDHGSPVAEWTIDGRTTTALVVPPTAPGALRKFRLHLPGGGAPVLDDPRILNLAVFHCDWVAPNPAQSVPPSLASSIRENSSIVKRLLGDIRKFQGSWALLASGPIRASRSARLLAHRGSDIFEAGMDFQLGPGWYYREESGDDRFRWVSKDARFLLRMPQGTSTLGLLVEPGPAQERAVLVVRSGDERGEVLAKTPLQGLTYFEFPVPAAPGTIAPLCLTPEPPGSPAGADSRLLSFRVFACGAGKRSLASSPDARAWLTLHMDSKPATKDWTSRREASPQLLEMGKPAYLHTNTCTDFTLMARQHWFDLRGCSELDLPADHLDALFCYAAHHAGAREHVLEDPLRIYRAPGAEPSKTPPASPQLASALHDDLLWLIANMRALHVPVIFNGFDWGLADHNLSASRAHS
jgi:hypothetical protein